MVCVWKEIPVCHCSALVCLGVKIKMVKEKKKKKRFFFRSKSSRKMFWIGSGEMGSSQGFCQAGAECQGPSFAGCSASLGAAFRYPSDLNQRGALGFVSELKKLCGKQRFFRKNPYNVYTHVCARVCVYIHIK